VVEHPDEIGRVTLDGSKNGRSAQW